MPPPLTIRLRAIALAATALAVALATSPARLTAQAVGPGKVDLDFALEQAFTSVDGLASPTGYRLAVGLPGLVGPFGLEVAYRSVSERLGEHAAYCRMDSCIPGPFDAAMRMRAASVGLSWARLLNPFVELSVGGLASLTWQDARYAPTAEALVDLVEHPRDEAGPDLGAGAFVTWRFPPLLTVLRPMLFARADWVGAGTCAADDVCWGSRWVGSGGIGMYARIP